MRWRKRVIALVVGLAAVAAVAFAVRPEPIRVQSGRVVRGAMRVTLEEEGQTRVRERYAVVAPTTGTLERIDLDAGAAVETGDVVARISPTASPLLDPSSRAQGEARLRAARAARGQAEATIARAGAALEFARAEAQRMELLARRQVVERRRLELARTEKDARQAELEAATEAARMARFEEQAALASLGRGRAPTAQQIEIRSPVRGRVLRVLRTSFGFVPSGTPLLELGDVSDLEVVVDVLTSDAASISAGTPVELRWGPETPLGGAVRSIEPSAFTRVSALGVEEQRVNVIVELRSPAEVRARLGDGFRVEATIVVWQAEAVLRAPASALFRRGARWAVFRIEKGRARLRTVRIGRQGTLHAEVLAGLKAGDRVVLHPGEAIEDGSRVRTR